MFDSDNQQEMIFELVQNSTGITASLAQFVEACMYYTCKICFNTKA